MGKLQDRKEELRLKARRYESEIEANLLETREEIGDLLKNILISTGAGLAVWMLGSGLASLLGKSKKRKGRFGKAMVNLVSPMAAKVIVDLLKDQGENGSEKHKIDVAAKEDN